MYRSGDATDLFPEEGDPAETSVMVEWGGTVRTDTSKGEGSSGRRGHDGQLEMKIREPRLVQDFAWERALQQCTIVSVACGEVSCSHQIFVFTCCRLPMPPPVFVSIL